MKKRYYAIALLVSLVCNIILFFYIAFYSASQKGTSKTYFYILEDEAILNLSTMQDVGASGLKYKFMGTISGFLKNVKTFNKGNIEDSSICNHWNPKIKKDLIVAFSKEEAVEVKKDLGDILSGINNLDNICKKIKMK